MIRCTYLHSSKHAQEGQVHRVTLPLPERQKHESDGSKERHPHCPLVRLDPVLVWLREEGHGAECRGEKELNYEDGIDLANELHADGESSFCD